ncbi:KilA-N domain-containing protein [Escherichia coli]|nr:KilA-N domain-containing protein [Escherichia coli]
MNIVPLNYKGEPIRFNTDGWINATDIAKSVHFGWRLDHWLSNAETLGIR